MKTIQPLGPNQERWLKKLETGGLPQTKGCLQDKNGFCCLGVAAKMFKPKNIRITVKGVQRERSFDNNSCCAPPYVEEALSLYSNVAANKIFKIGESLAHKNDHGTPFPEIAALVRADPAQYFKEPR